MDESAAPDRLAEVLRIASRGADPGLTTGLVDAAHADPEGTALGDVAKSALAAGVEREDILRACEAARLEIRTAAGSSREYDDPAEDRVLDLMDRLSGWCHPSSRL
ncbi:hypothetical protein [Amycolatopsis vancoresmycina]|uniref:hypothetical protein n=1 Tax=Amycolatopsis vancoresmycina TaxID=208444 RepID=UPI00052520E9|nr:hypothetical protein [Amycolatopsis vancoresmycina]